MVLTVLNEVGVSSCFWGLFLIFDILFNDI